jgi:hypothetical protein
VQVAIKPPSAAVAVISVVPAERGVTLPPVDTVATAGLLLDHVSDLLDAFDGEIVAVSVSAPSMVAVDLFRAMPVTGTTRTDVLAPPFPQAFTGLTHTLYGVPLNNRSVSVTVTAVTLCAGFSGIAVVAL